MVQVFGAFRKGKAGQHGCLLHCALCIYTNISLDVYVPQNIGSPTNSNIPSIIVISQSPDDETGHIDNPLSQRAVLRVAWRKASPS